MKNDSLPVFRQNIPQEISTYGVFGKEKQYNNYYNNSLYTRI